MPEELNKRGSRRLRSRQKLRSAMILSIRSCVAILVAPFILTLQAEAAKPTCSCDASFEVRFDIPRSPLLKAYVPGNHFTALKTKGSVQTMNACRRDARDQAHACMDNIWKKRSTPSDKPSQCATHTGIRGSVPYDVKFGIEYAACGMGLPVAKSHAAVVKVYRRTHGDAGCGPNLDKTKSVFISNYTVDCLNIRSRLKMGMVAETKIEGIDRPGSDFCCAWETNGIKVGNGSVEACKAACEQKNGCRAWTWVPPGVQGSDSRCWLKDSVPWHKVHATSAKMVSGTRQHNSQ